MKKQSPFRMLIALLLSVLCTAAAVAQDKSSDVRLKGLVRDRATNSHLVGAQVEILNSSDSILGKAEAADYSWNNTSRALEESARFSVSIPKANDVFTIRIAYEGYDTVAVPLDLTDLGRREFDRDLGTYYMSRTRINTLNEVTVAASKVKFYNKGDTLVYNADAFQLAEGSMLDELIKQLPGVEIRDGGRIYVNGKYVESLLLNGKDFFRGDNQVMLDNLAAYTVDKVEVYDKQSDDSKFLGRESKEGEQYVMDVKIKKEYIGGWNFNIQGGAGTEDRYMGRLFGMHFTGSSQFTLLGNVNNLNDSRRPTQDDSWDPESATNGTKKFREGGLDYSVDKDRGKAQGSVMVTSSDNLFRQRTASTNFLPSFDTYGNSFSDMVSKDVSVRTNHELSYQTEIAKWTLRPEFSYSTNSSESESSSTSSLSDMQVGQSRALIERLLSGQLSASDRQGLINVSADRGNSSAGNYRAALKLSSVIKIPKMSDYINIDASFTHSGSHSKSRSLNLLSYGDSTLMPVARSQTSDNSPRRNTAYQVGAGYNLVVNDKLRLALRYQFSYEHLTDNSSFFLGQMTSGNPYDYNIADLAAVAQEFDPANSYLQKQNSMEQAVKATAEWKPNKKFRIKINAPVTFVDNKLDYTQDGAIYHASFKSSTLPRNASANIDFNTRNDSTRRSLNLSLSYDLSSTLPTLRDMITVDDTRNPLASYLGNPDLKAGINHSANLYVSLGFRHFYLSGGANYQCRANDIVRGYTYETATGRYIYKSYNVDASYNAGGYIVGQGYWDKISFFSVIFYNVGKGYDMIGENSVEPEETSMRTRSVSFQNRLDWNISSKVELSVEAEPNFSFYRSDRSTVADMNTHSGQYAVRARFELPMGWGISSRMALLTRRGYEDADLNTSDWIWNARLWKTLCKGRLMLAVSAYDLLRKMRSTFISISPQSRSEMTTNTIPRYILFHMQYRFDIQPKKQLANRKRYY